MDSLPTDVKDEQLIGETLAGNSAAFGQLVRKHRETLLAVSLRMLANREEAEDVVQKVFIEAYRHLADFRHGAQFSTWLHAITVNCTRNHLRARKAHRTISLDPDPSDDRAWPGMVHLRDKSPTPDQVVGTRMDAAWILESVRELSKDHRDIFVLHYIQDLPLSEISKRLKRPLGTVKVYLHRARKEMAILMRQKAGERPPEAPRTHSPG